MMSKELKKQLAQYASDVEDGYDSCCVDFIGRDKAIYSLYWIAVREIRKTLFDDESYIDEHDYKYIKAEIQECDDWLSQYWNWREN